METRDFIQEYVCWTFSTTSCIVKPKNEDLAYANSGYIYVKTKSLKITEANNVILLGLSRVATL